MAYAPGFLVFAFRPARLGTGVRPFLVSFSFLPFSSFYRVPSPLVEQYLACTPPQWAAYENTGSITGCSPAAKGGSISARDTTLGLVGTELGGGFVEFTSLGRPVAQHYGY